MASKSKKQQQDIALQQFREGVDMVASHPMFYYLERKTIIFLCPAYRFHTGLAYVSSRGSIYCRPNVRATPAQWARVIAHGLLHLGMEHFKNQTDPLLWNTACDLVVEKFLTDLKFGTPMYDATLPNGIHDEERLYEKFRMEGVAPEYMGFGTAGVSPDMFYKTIESHHLKNSQWSLIFAQGLNAAVTEAVQVVSNNGTIQEGHRHYKTVAEMEKEWFISSFPLLGAVAANFKLIEDPLVCQRMDIRVAAISAHLSELYIHPAAGLDRAELRFVMAHEFLHAALRHDGRQEWRDAYLWNVACDFVINLWLTEMNIGERPEGLLYDEKFKGMSAEGVYDIIVTNMRFYRKLATLRGVGLGDILPGNDRWWERGDGMDLDAFYRRALGQGLSYHQSQGRGFLPAGLIEEIRALSHPPIPWDVALARWFDDHFTPIVKNRSYYRPSRRQSATPDIPRPNWVVSQSALDGRTFGVILDTSGSMDRALLASALGAIASYSMARDVPAARVVFCDAAAYDQGYVKPEDIADSVQIKGRGGTVLQPAIELLHSAEDFPKEAPILIITDGGCDKLVLYGREHAFLMPTGATLPFIAKGQVFRIS